MKGCTQQEILGVLAHELGHWSLSHTLKLLGISQVLLPHILSGMYTYIYRRNWFVITDLRCVLPL